MITKCIHDQTYSIAIKVIQIKSILFIILEYFHPLNFIIILLIYIILNSFYL